MEVSRLLGIALLGIALSGCASSNALPLAQDTVQITSSAAPACGSGGAQKIALQRAAAETIRRGYDRFQIFGADARTDVRVVGYTPVQANTTGSATAISTGNIVTAHGSSSTIVTGGQPIYGGSHKQGLIIKMYREGDPSGANALSARDTLGPNWQELASKNSWNCF
jgi:hypothetical protein